MNSNVMDIIAKIDDTIINKVDDSINYIDRILPTEVSKFLTNNTIHNLSVICDKWDIDFESYYGYNVGTHAVVFMYEDYALKATMDIPQCMDCIILKNNPNDYAITVHDVYMNVILMECADIEAPKQYDHLGDLIKGYVNSEYEMNIKIVSDCVLCYKYYQHLFNIDHIDASLRNIGLNSHGNYVIFDW